MRDMEGMMEDYDEGSFETMGELLALHIEEIKELLADDNSNPEDVEDAEREVSPPPDGSKTLSLDAIGKISKPSHFGGVEGKVRPLLDIADAGKGLVAADGQTSHLLADREVSLPPDTPLSLACVLGGSAPLPSPVVDTPFFSLRKG